MNLANKITILRILLTPFFLACIIYYGDGKEYLRLVAFTIFAIASLTDAIDGGIARSRDQITELGVILDPIADKLLIVTAFIALSVVKKIPMDLKIPPWSVLIVLSRDVIIVLGSLIIYFIKGNVAIKPSILGKITTFFQMIAIMAVLIPFRYNKVFLYPAVLLTMISCIDYIWRGSKQLNENPVTSTS
ncbi:MAG: CDP-alcohol phosphatidyltransferase family protein [Candidatus Omnitrophota bacterium]